MNPHLSKQKLEIDARASELQKVISKIASDRQVLLKGMEALDNGEDMLRGNSMLAQEVHKIMRSNYDPLSNH